MLQFTFPKEKPKSNQKFLKLGKFVQIHNFFYILWEELVLLQKLKKRNLYLLRIRNLRKKLDPALLRIRQNLRISAPCSPPQTTKYVAVTSNTKLLLILARGGKPYCTRRPHSKTKKLVGEQYNFGRILWTCA